MPLLTLLPVERFDVALRLLCRVDAKARICVRQSYLSCIGLVTTVGEVVEDSLCWFGDARWCSDPLAAEADGR